MKKLPIGKQVFRKVIEGNCVYVDKTEHLINLIESESPIFLSRPRRFGKSMTTYTFAELFKGSKELFKGTYAYDNWDFDIKHPVVRLDMSTLSTTSIEAFKEGVLEKIKMLAQDFDISPKDFKSAPTAFEALIRKISTKGSVVILIDEYDSPILNSLDKPILDEIKEILRDLYKVIKASEEYLKFVFITGISKFSKLGVFSAMNNLYDITLISEYSTITGYTRNEIDRYFREYIELAKKELNYSEEQFWEKLKHYYNGYSWDGKNFVFNPFSVLNFFANFRFAPYWMETGSPSYIVNYAEKHHISLENLKNKVVDNYFMDRKDIDYANPESFLTQAGYLTITDINEFGDITLDFPNFEVEYTFNNLLLESQYKVSTDDFMGVKQAMRKALIEDNVQEVIKQIKCVYSSVAYIHFDNNKNEHFYHTLLLMFLRGCGFTLLTEDLSNKGRSDLALFWENSVYLIELKVDGSAKSALEQIIEKNYSGKYANKNITHIGLKIDFNERNIVEDAWGRNN